MSEADPTRAGNLAAPDSTEAVTEDDIRSAADRLRGVAHRTPVLTSRTLDRFVGARVVLKAECLQRMGAFKFRGAYNCVRQLNTDQLAAGVTAGSSGNHAQALSLAARLCGSRALVLMPEDAPSSKRLAAREYGGEIVSYDRYTGDRESLVRGLAAEHGMTIVHGYNDARIIAGAGTTALEVVEDEGPIDVLVVPTGGGGLLAGCAAAVNSNERLTRVIGVEPAASDDVQRSFRAGKIISVAVEPTIADGQQLAAPGRIPFAIIRELVDDVVTVSDEEIVAAMRFLFERMKLVVEPSGASALAAVMCGRIQGRGQRIGVVLSGGNVDAKRFFALMSKSD